MHKIIFSGNTCIAVLASFDPKYFLRVCFSIACLEHPRCILIVSSLGFFGWLTPLLKLRGVHVQQPALHTYRYLLCVFSVRAADVPSC